MTATLVAGVSPSLVGSQALESDDEAMEDVLGITTDSATWTRPDLVLGVIFLPSEAGIARALEDRGGTLRLADVCAGVVARGDEAAGSGCQDDGCDALHV